MSNSKPTGSLRPARLDDLPGIVKIYNDIIQEGGLTADLTTYQINEKVVWFEQMTTIPYFIQVLEINDIVSGYVYLSPWRKDRASLQSVAEISYYLAGPYRGRGFGRMLLREGIHLAKKNGFTTLLAILLDSNIPSISLLKSEGFHAAGHLPKVAQLASGAVGQYIMMKGLIEYGERES